MTTNAELIPIFYSAFQRLDYKTMQDCYHKEATFSDPVFGTLNAAEVKAMWEMLCKRAKNFSLEYSEVQAGPEEGSCVWVAHYTFGKTGRPVVNTIHAHFRFKEGKILSHQDQFDLWKWSRQALGPVGLFLGWTPFFQNKIRREARSSLKI